MIDDPVYIEIDETSWRGHVANIETWLGNVLADQVAFRLLVESVQPKLREPHFRKFVGEIAETALRHEKVAEGFYAMIGRPVPDSRKLAGSAAAQARKLAAEAMASAGGAQGTWPDLLALLPAALHAQTSFAVAEQLALAVGLREMAEAAFAVENEQSRGFLVLKELMLETAAIAILYKVPV